MATSRQERTFLVVDDEPDILDAIQRLFRKDYRVLTARTAAEALELVEDEDVQVVMSDQRMPRMSGIEFLAQLRETHPEIVRVLFTGYSNIDHVIDAINEGHVYRYISKPWKPSELKLFVAQAFEHYESRRERNQLLEQLTEANEQLEQQNAMLSSANEELKILDRMKNVFMEVVSHELNTPIAIILGYVFLLRKELDGKYGNVTDKALGGIDSSAIRLKNISNRIFKMLSEEGPASTLNLEKMRVADFIAEVNDHVSPFLQKREQRLEVQIASEVDAIEADREKLTDVFLNLIMNAIKFSHDGQTIQLSIEQSSRDEDLVAFCVEDEGIGISEEDLAQIFNAFFSTFESRHHSSGDFEFCKRGIGLGLSVAKRFTEMHGGCIEVDSVEGKGSRFTVLLPREPGAVEGLQQHVAFREKSAAS
ncbi:hybrid sensor histidine kinase/response regulator [Persicimonas caeni]|nr:hybrid sensor histidine kinase/response regulator [Persicimonas caeni]